MQYSPWRLISTKERIAYSCTRLFRLVIQIYKNLRSMVSFGRDEDVGVKDRPLNPWHS